MSIRVNIKPEFFGNDCMKKVNVTIKDIALKTGVSKSTVSRALSNDSHIKKETKEKIIACAKVMNFIPNFYAQSLKVGKTGTLAFFVPNIENMIYPSLVHPVAEQARERGYSLLFCDTHEDPEIAMEYVVQLKARQVDGFIFSIAHLDDDPCNEAIKVVREDGYPYICLLRMSPFGNDSIIVDNEKGAESAIDYLVSKGKRRILFVQGQPELWLYQKRLEGYINGLAKNHIPFDSSLVIKGFSGPDRIAYESTKNYLQHHEAPDAIFGSADPIAIDVIRALAEKGLNVPNDVSVIGFDNLPISEMLNPRLTTVSQPFSDMGRRAVDRLIDCIEGKLDGTIENELFETHIVERDSVK